jgi:YYY domain-containing protein
MLMPQLVYMVLLVIGLGLSWQLDPAAYTQSTARWIALVRTPTLPPPDLFFAGGHDPLPYTGQLPFALLAKLVAILPTTGLRLALATALALAIGGLWSVVHAIAPRQFARDALWNVLVVVLIMLPGLLLSDTLGFSPWLAFVRLDLDTLVLAALAATALVLGAGRLRQLRFAWLLLPLLVLIGGYGLAITLAVWLALLAIAWRMARHNTRSILGIALALLAGAFLLTQPFTWSVAPRTQQNAPVIGTMLRLVPSVILPLLVLTFFKIVSTRVPTVDARRYRRVRLIWMLALIAAGLFLGTALALAGKLHSDIQHLVTVASVLLIVAAGWTLAWLLQAQQPTNRQGWLQPVVLALAVVLSVGALGTNVARARAEAGTVSPNVASQNALRFVAANTVGSPVLVAAPQAAADWSAVTGLQALIAAPERERRLRQWLAPAVDGVIDRRLEALSEIYGPNPDAAQQALETYHVGYVVLGPTEQALFPNANATLETLAAQNTVGRVYDQDGVTIYQHTVPDRTPPFVARTASLQLPSPKSLLLDQPVGSLPLVDEYAWNRVASAHSLLGIGLWLVVIELLGLLAFPLVRRVFGRWHDGGWGLSKIVGLLAWGYAVWLPVSLGWWVFNWWALLFGALALGISGFGFWILDRRRFKNRELVTRHSILRSELWFLGTFALWTLVRAANPDLWHPIYGGEKPFEFGFLNAILRSPVLPPYDPFFSDGIVNYYYYGLFLMALPMKATGIDPAIGFNLAIALLFALTTTATLALGREISGRWRWGLLAVFFLVGMGPLASIVRVGEGRGLEPVLEAIGGGWAGVGARLGAWFWGPSRIITKPFYTINEFPLFSFLFADLHPHLIALPITLVAVACALEFGRRRPQGGLLALSALVLGALAIANSWDAPTYALVIGGAAVGRTWQRARGRLPLRQIIVQLGLAALAAVAVLVAGIVLYFPFFSHYQAMVGGIGLVEQGDRVVDWLLWFGPLLFIAISLLGVLVWRAAYRADVRWRWAVRAVALFVPLLPVVLLLSGWIGQASDGLALRLLLAILGGVGVGLALRLRLRLRDWLPLWLITVGVLVALGVQLVFVRDHLANSSSERMNTVFKFGFQIWTLWSIGAATALPLVVRHLRRYETMFGIWLGLLGITLLPGLVYPLAGIPSRLATRFDTAQPLTLDGLAFMQRAQYEHQDRTINLEPDAEAIAWLKQNIQGTPVFLTSELEFYRAYGMRIAANTGLPTVLGKLHQDEQRDPQAVRERERDVQTLFNTTDLDEAQQLLRKYRVNYVYIGPVERALYAAEGIAKFAQLQNSVLYPVYDNKGVTIYRVNTDALQHAGANDRSPPPAQVDDETGAMEAQLTADPSDSSAAFALGRRYLELDRATDAVRAMERAVRAHPDDVPLYHLWGDAWAHAGRADDAIAAWQHAVDVARTPNNLTKLGGELVRMDRFDAAERTLNQALALDPAFGEALFALGELYRTRNAPGDRDRAITQYQLCLERAAPDSPWRERATAEINTLKIED